MNKAAYYIVVVFSFTMHRHQLCRFNPISPGGGGGGFRPPWETFLNNSKTTKDIKMKFFKFNLTHMGGILHIMTILINLRCCHGNLLL